MSDNNIITYEQDVLKPPQHLNIAFFEEVVENALRLSNFKIENIKFTMGSSVGENYCSEIYRARIHYKMLLVCQTPTTTTQVLSVIIKSIPRSKSTEFLQDLQVYLKEKITYSYILPRMETLLGNAYKLGACLYHSIKEPLNTLVFEDLSVDNFQMACRETGLDDAHCRLVMQRLAQFHAASMVLYKMDNKIMKSYSDGMLAQAGLEQDDGMLMRYFSGNVTALIELAQKWPGYEKITKKLQNYAANLRENLLRSQAPLGNELKVLNHGDLWVNNLLFKYDNATTTTTTTAQQPKVQDVIFIDFQLSIWGSPGIDLNYFFYTSLQYNTMTEKRNELIGEYHRVLTETLIKLHYDDVLPSYAEILQEVQQRAPYGFFANYGIYPTVSMDKASSSDNSLDNFADEEFAKNKLKQIFASKRLEENMRYTLKHFDELGVLD